MTIEEAITIVKGYQIFGASQKAVIAFDMAIEALEKSRESAVEQMSKTSEYVSDHVKELRKCARNYSTYPELEKLLRESADIIEEQSEKLHTENTDGEDE